MLRKTHWENVYETKPSDTVSWYEAVPTQSMAMLAVAGLSVDSSVVDVGGGDSLLAGVLVDRGIRSVTVVELSRAALARAQARIGDKASRVTWLEGDITTLALPSAAYDIWHDRAVFHFLTDPDDRARYTAAAARSVRLGGAVVIGTFALDGPTRCSGLEVARYSPEGLAAEFGDAFVLRHGIEDVHRTPSGAEQRFAWAVLTRV